MAANKKELKMTKKQAETIEHLARTGMSPEYAAKLYCIFANKPMAAVPLVIAAAAEKTNTDINEWPWVNKV